MQMPPGKAIRAVQLLNGGALPYAIADGRLTIGVPAGVQDKIDTIIAVEFTTDLADVAPIAYAGGGHDAAAGIAALTPFAYQLVYGARLTSGLRVSATSLAMPAAASDLAQVVTRPAAANQGFATSAQPGAAIIVALDQARFVTGIALAADAAGAPLALEGSVDGRRWQPIWQVAAAGPGLHWDIEVNDVKAGAETPGRLLRFLRLKVTGAEPRALTLRQFHIWAKDAK